MHAVLQAALQGIWTSSSGHRSVGSVLGALPSLLAARAQTMPLPVPVWLASRLFAHLRELQEETEMLIALERTAISRFDQGIDIIRNLMVEMIEEQRKKEAYLKSLQDRLGRLQHEIDNLPHFVAGSGVSSTHADQEGSCAIVRNQIEWRRSWLDASRAGCAQTCIGGRHPSAILRRQGAAYHLTELGAHLLPC